MALKQRRRRRRQQQRHILIRAVLALLACGALFQNCSPAGPPDVSNVTQASTSVAPVPPSPNPPPVSTPISTPVPTPAPVTQTYSWSVGAWSVCSGGQKIRPVKCLNNSGSLVANTYCAATVATPASNEACSSYTCTATLTLPNEFISTGFCSYTCVGAVSYSAFATDASNCSPNPIGVAGTQTGWDPTFTTVMDRPFSSCVITKAISYTNGYYTGESVCQ
jgi:hypothetical protein